MTLKPQLLIAFVNTAAGSLTLGSKYWIVLKQSGSISGGKTIAISASTASSSGYHAYSSDGTTWTAQANMSCYYRLFGYIDNNRVSQGSVRRGVKLTGQAALSPRRLQVSVPLMDQIDTDHIPDIADPSGGVTSIVDTTTQNEMLVTVTARKGSTGTPKSFNVTIPQHSARGYQVLIGTATDLFDRVDNVVVTPGTNLSVGADNIIKWSLYDLITVEAVP